MQEKLLPEKIKTLFAFLTIFFISLVFSLVLNFGFATAKADFLLMGVSETFANIGVFSAIILFSFLLIFIADKRVRAVGHISYFSFFVITYIFLYLVHALILNSFDAQSDLKLTSDFWGSSGAALWTTGIVIILTPLFYFYIKHFNRPWSIIILLISLIIGSSSLFYLYIRSQPIVERNTSYFCRSGEINNIAPYDLVSYYKGTAIYMTAKEIQEMKGRCSLVK